MGLQWGSESKPTRERSLRPEPPGGTVEATKPFKHSGKRPRQEGRECAGHNCQRSSDYADASKHKRLTLACTEFVRRLQLHILPERFVKPRHYGLLANRNRHTRIAAARAALPPAPPSIVCSTVEAATSEPVTPQGLPTRFPHCNQQADWILIRRLPRPTFPVPILDSS